MVERAGALPLVRPCRHAEPAGIVDGGAPELGGPFGVAGPATAVEHVGQRGAVDRVARPVADGEVRDDRRLQVIDRQIDIAEGQRGEPERPVRRAEARHREARHDGQVGVRLQELVGVPRGLRIAEEVGGVARAEHRRRPDARRRYRGEPSFGAQRGERGPGGRMVTGGGGERGDGGDEPGARLGHGRRRDEVAEQREHLLAPSLEPADGDELGAVPAEGVGVTDVDPERVTPVGELLGLGEPPVAHREHHVHGGDEIAQAVAAVHDEMLPELSERAGGPAVAGQEQVDGAPGETHQPVDGPPGRRRDGDQLIGEPEPPGRVLRTEQAVVRQRKGLGQLERFRSCPGLLELAEDRGGIAGHVRLLGGEADPQPPRE